MHIKALFGLCFSSTPTLLQHCLFDFEAKSCSSCPMLQFCFSSAVYVLPNWSLHARLLCRKTLHTLGVKVWDFFSSCSSAVCASRKFFTLLFCTRTKEIVMYEYVIFMVISEKQSFILNTQKDSELFNKCTPNWGQKGTPQANDQSALVSLVKDNVNGSYL